MTAVLVAHDGERWLPETLAALQTSTRVPAAVVCVDTGSTDGSAALLERAHGSVVQLPRDTGFPAAVAAGLAQGPRSTWVWLLHDDCAVEPGTLQALLEQAEQTPSAVLLGAKARDWSDPRVLVEVGVTTDSAGHRETGLERREYDQGQHDAVRDVLAVGTAGALVRRDVWDTLGGLDPALPVFRDDLDLGWRVNAAGHRVLIVPAATVRHARAATTGHRQTDAAPGRATATDRRNALWVLLAHASLVRLLGLVPRLLLGTALHALSLLLTRQVTAAGDEVRALAGVLSHPVRLRRARAARAATRTVSQRDLRPLFAHRSNRLRARVGAMGDRLSGGSATVSVLGDPGAEGPDELLDLGSGGSGTLRRLLLRPGTLLVLTLALVALVAERSVLIVRGGVLSGGRLLPVPPGARDLWAAYAGAWHDSVVGSAAPSPPSTGALALLSTLLLGKPWLAVDVLLLASVPLAGATAYVASGRLSRHLTLRIWAAATWALLPVATGAVAAGRLGSAAVQIGLPPLLVGAGRLLVSQPRTAGWWRAWGVGLGLAVLAAFAPLLWPLLGGGLVLAAAVRLRRSPAGALACLLPALVPVVLLVPWSLSALAHPGLLLADLGPLPGDLPPSGLQLLLLHPGGPGLPALLVTLGLLLAAVGGTLRVGGRHVARVAWALALGALLTAGLLAHARLGLPGGSGRVTPWSGPAVQLAGAGMLIAALVGANGVRTRLQASSFGLRQLTAGLVVVLAATVPVLAAGNWVQRGADTPLHRGSSALLPAFAQAELAGAPGLRALTLAPGADGRLAWELTSAVGSRFELAATPPARAQVRALDAVVADLVSATGSDAALALSTRAVRYVALRVTPATRDLVSVLDRQPGLVRRTSGPTVLWQVVSPSARLVLLPPPLAAVAVGSGRAPTADLLRTSPAVALPTRDVGASATVPPGAVGRLLVLADAVDQGWQATVDGRRLTRRTAWGWAQGFEVPAAGGHLELRHEQGVRRSALRSQAGLLALVAVLSVPGRRRGSGLEDDEEPTL